MAVPMGAAVVVLSGGQDSTTCLFWARERFTRVYALTFNYGQRHAREVEAAKAVAKLARVESHEVLDLGEHILLSSSPLIDPTQKVQMYKSADVLPGGLEDTFIPGRNILFLTLAGNRACHHKASAIVTGLCEADYGGYYDCRRAFVSAMKRALCQGLYGCLSGVHLFTPLMSMTKANTVQLARALPGCYDALAYTHTCYEGKFPPCGHCHACLLRARGFEQAGIEDPLILRAQHKQWKMD